MACETSFRTAAHIAWRYFFSRKSTNAVHIIAIVSVCCVAIVATAMVCILSIFNGFEEFTTTQLSHIAPAYTVEKEGKGVYDASELADSLSKSQDPTYAPILETRALVQSGSNSMIARLVGIDKRYAEVVDMEPALFDGRFDVGTEEYPLCVVGVGVGAALNTGADYFEPLEVVVPRRLGRVSMSMPERNFVRRTIPVGGIFRLDQPEDNEVIYLPIKLLREMLQYGEMDVTQIALSKEPPITATYFSDLGLHLLDRVQQHPDLYRIVRVEKWVSFALMTFVLLLSLFSVVSTLGMLIIEKREDFKILRTLGAPRQIVDRVIFMESWLLSISGLVIGGAIGILLVSLQKWLGIVKLGGSQSPGTFLLDAYPVALRWADLLLVAFVILLVGWIGSRIAYRIFRASRG